VKLVWTRLALADLRHVHDYIAAERPRAAAEITEHISRATRMIAEHPEMGRHGRVAGTRELVVAGTPFLFAYRVRGERVEVLALLHAARRWPDSL
jgi:addiction module RelE/StbE family toxin